MKIEELIEEVAKAKKLHSRLYDFLSLLGLLCSVVFSYKLSLLLPVDPRLLSLMFSGAAIAILRRNKPDFSTSLLIDERLGLHDRLKSYDALTEGEQEKKKFISDQIDELLKDTSLAVVKEKGFLPAGGFRYPIILCITFLFWTFILNIIPSKPPISEELQKLVASLQAIKEESHLSEDTKEAIEKLKNTIEDFSLGSASIDKEIQKVEEKLQEEEKKNNEEKKKEESSSSPTPPPQAKGKPSPTPSSQEQSTPEPSKESTEQKNEPKDGDKKEEKKSDDAKNGEDKQDAPKPEEQKEDGKDKGSEGKKSESAKDKEGEGDGSGKGKGKGQGSDSAPSDGQKAGGKSPGQGSGEGKGEGEGSGAKDGTQGSESANGGGEKSELQKAQEMLNEIKKAQQEAKSKEQSDGSNGQSSSADKKDGKDSSNSGDQKQRDGQKDQQNKPGSDPKKEGSGKGAERKGENDKGKNPDGKPKGNDAPSAGGPQGKDQEEQKAGDSAGEKDTKKTDENAADKRLSDIPLIGGLGEGMGFKDEQIEVKDEQVDNRFALGEVQPGDETKEPATSKYKEYHKLDAVPEIKDYNSEVKIPPEYQGIINYDHH
jgi:hypothetical protein